MSSSTRATIPEPSYPFYLYSRFRLLSDMLFGRVLPALTPARQDLSGKTAIITGSNVGIGLEAARDLANMRATVILACRNKEKAEKARRDILDGAKGAIEPEKVEVKLLDCADLEDVRRFANEWGERKLDILINNAGITVGTFSKNPQGFEQTYATNVLSHQLLIQLLLPHMQEEARIVNVASAGNYGVASQFDVTDLDYSNFLSNSSGLKEGDLLVSSQSMELYSRTKLLQIYLTRDLQTRLDASDKYKDKNITVHSYHPGLVKTTIWHREGTLNLSRKDLLIAFVNFFGVHPQQGAATAVHLSTSLKAQKNRGAYWERMGLRAPNRLTEDKLSRAKVWERMEEEAGVPVNLRL